MNTQRYLKLTVASLVVLGCLSAFAAEPTPSSDDTFHAIKGSKEKSASEHKDVAHAEKMQHSTEGSTSASHDMNHGMSGESIHEASHASAAEHESTHGSHESAHGGHEGGHEGGHGEHEGGHNHFAGTFAFITDEAKSTKANISGGPSEFSGVSKSEVAPAAAIGINFALSPTQTFGVVLSGDLKKGEYGSFESESATVKLDENSHYELAFEPGMVIAPKMLGFLIFGIHQASVTAETNFGGIDGNETKNLTGFSIGLGSKLVLADHVFGVFEYQHLKYTGLDIANIRISPSSDAFSLGLGYHF